MFEKWVKFKAHFWVHGSVVLRILLSFPTSPASAEKFLQIEINKKKLSKNDNDSRDAEVGTDLNRTQIV